MDRELFKKAVKGRKPSASKTFLSGVVMENVL